MPTRRVRHEDRVGGTRLSRRAHRGAENPLLRPSSPEPALPPRTVALAPGRLAHSEYEDEADRTPTAKEIHASIPLLRTRVETIELAAGRRPFGSYYLQYAGLRDGTLAVNAPCDVHDMDWRTYWVAVNDGGACYWHAELRNGRIEQFIVNGQA